MSLYAQLRQVRSEEDAKDAYIMHDGKVRLGICAELIQPTTARIFV